jgi:hypothetical protein
VRSSESALFWIDSKALHDDSGFRAKGAFYSELIRFKMRDEFSGCARATQTLL